MEPLLFSPRKRPSEDASKLALKAEKRQAVRDKDISIQIQQVEDKPKNDSSPKNNSLIQEASQIEDRVLFEKLRLSETLVNTCKEMGMRKSTPVQTACIPAILDGRHVIAISQTGSGKTAAYALPILEVSVII